MMTTGCCSIKQALVDHLLSRIEVQQVRDMCIATLPISTLDRRWVDVFIEPRAADYFLVHDGGKAVNELILQGMRITDSVTRGFQMTASRLGVSYADEMFQSGTKIENLPSVVNKVGMCSALAMTNLLEGAPAVEERTLEDDIRPLLKRWGKQRATLRENFKVEGEVKQHTFDFVLTPKRREPITVSVLHPTAGPLSAAERFGFKAKDLEATDFGRWKRIAVEAKAEVWSRDAHRIVSKFADAVVVVPSGRPATFSEFAEALDRLAA